jgi:hypothetical protein
MGGIELVETGSDSPARMSAGWVYWTLGRRLVEPDRPNRHLTNIDHGSRRLIDSGLGDREFVTGSRHVRPPHHSHNAGDGIGLRRRLDLSARAPRGRPHTCRAVGWRAGDRPDSRRIALAPAGSVPATEDSTGSHSRGPGPARGSEPGLRRIGLGRRGSSGSPPHVLADRLGISGMVRARAIRPPLPAHPAIPLLSGPPSHFGLSPKPRCSGARRSSGGGHRKVASVG